MPKKSLIFGTIMIISLIIALQMTRTPTIDIQNDDIPLDLYSTESYIATYGQFIDAFTSNHLTDESKLKQLNTLLKSDQREDPISSLDYAYYMALLLDLGGEPLTIEQFNNRHQYVDYSLLPLSQRTSILKLIDLELYQASHNQIHIEGYMSQTLLSRYMSDMMTIQDQSINKKKHLKEVEEFLDSTEKPSEEGYITMDIYLQGVAGLVALIHDLDDTGSVYDVNKFAITLLHFPDYTPYVGGSEGLFWQLATGTPVESFRQFNTYVTLNPEELDQRQQFIIQLSEFLKNTLVQDPYSGEPIDMKHLMGTLDALYHEREIDNSSSGFDFMLNQMAGWAGDLISLEMDLDATSTYKAHEIDDLIGTDQSSHFMFSDYAADLDAMNIYHILKGENMLLSEAIIWYYDSGTYHREQEFLNNLGGEQAFDDIICLIMTPEKAKYIVFESYELRKDSFIRFLQEVHQALLGEKPNREQMELLKNVFYDKIIKAANTSN